MDKEKKPAVRIPCNATVKNYTVATFQRLGLDAGPGKVYNKLVSGEGVVPRTNKEVNDLVDLLLKKIPQFLPPVPPTAAEIEKYKEFNQKWIDSIQKMKQRQFTPVYLRDEVNKVLERKQYSQHCKRIHLVWCLSLKGEKYMTPEKIADAIIEYDGTDWDNMLPLKNDTAYHVRLANATDKEKEKFLDTVEFIYALSSQSADPSIIEKLQNDLEVLAEIEDWKDNLTSYKYAERYEEMVGRLQTAPGVPKKRRGAKKSVMPTETKQEDTTAESKANVEDPMKESAASSEQVLQQQQPNGDINVPSSESATSGSSDNEESIAAEYGETEQWEQNYAIISEYLENVVQDEYGKQRIKDADGEIVKLCHLDNFDTRYNQLRTMIESGSVKYPGGFAALEIPKMLNPNYVPPQQY